jgi:hypothetical protein
VLLQRQLKLEREQYKLIIQTLQNADLFPEKPSGKKREGYLELRKPDRTWKKYYFILFTDSLTFFNLHDKVSFDCQIVIDHRLLQSNIEISYTLTILQVLPRGVILLDSMTSVRIEEPLSKTTVEKEKNADEKPVKSKFIVRIYSDHRSLCRYAQH